MPKRQKPIPPAHEFTYDEIVEWPPDALYEYEPRINDITALVKRCRTDGNAQSCLKSITEIVSERSEDGTFVMLADPDGNVGCLEARIVASYLFRTRNTQLAGEERLQRFEKSIDLVRVLGGQSNHYCSAYLGLVFSISGSDSRYPRLKSLPWGGAPFHPGCTKSTVAFVYDLATPAQIAASILPSQDNAMIDQRRSMRERIEAAKHRIARLGMK